jgi:predicted aspartyl protease
MRHASFAAYLAIATAVGADAPLAADCKMLRIAEWPARVENSQLLVNGAVNGQPVGIELDTGSTRTMMFRSAALRLGLTLRRTRFRMFGIGGETDVDVTFLDELKIGETTKRANVQMIIAGERDSGDEVALLLGNDFLQKFDVEFDLGHGVVRLFQPQGCENVSIAYWAASDARVASIEPVDPDRPQILLTVKVNGQPVQALLDSGAATSLLTKADAATAGVTPESPGVVRVGLIAGLGKKTIAAWAGPFESVEIGNERIKNTGLIFADFYKATTYTPPGSYVPRAVDWQQPMLLGVDFLASHRVLIAHSQRKIYFTYVAGPVFQTSFRSPPGQPVPTAPGSSPEGPSQPSQPAQPARATP